jgi:hypothetical protein
VTPDKEPRRLDGRAGDQPTANAQTVTTLATCQGDAADVLERTQDVMRTVLAHSRGPWPTVDQWRRSLPAWFVRACAPEQSSEEAMEWLQWWRSLPPNEQPLAARERSWTLSDWLYWLEPTERHWSWSGAMVEDPDHLHATVLVTEWPTALGALDWLLRTAGAVDVVHQPPQGQ